MQIKRNYIILIIIAIVVALISAIGYFLSHRKHNKLFLSGRLEGYETDVSPKVGGIIEYIVAREGAAIKKGELIARLDDSDLQARLKGANANIKVSEQQAKQAQLQINVVQNQISQGTLTVTQSQAESAANIGQAQASLSIAQTQLLQSQEQLRQAQSDLALATYDIRRYSALLGTGSIARRVYEQARTRYDIAKSSLSLRAQGVTTAQQQIGQARYILQQAQASRFTPTIRRQQVGLLQTQLLQAQSQYLAAKSNIIRSKADRDEILAQIAYLYVKSPINGIIISRIVEPGEVVAAGKTLLTLLNLNTVYLRGYIPEGDIGNVRVGQRAKVYLDSYPDNPLNACVSQIDITASFTPENIYFRNDRVKQVFGIRLNIFNPNGFAKPGMPADANILLGDKGTRYESCPTPH